MTDFYKLQVTVEGWAQTLTNGIICNSLLTIPLNQDHTIIDKRAVQSFIFCLEMIAVIHDCMFLNRVD